jgi:hypothetical protein
MANITRNFLAGRMNKVVDQRLLPDSEYVDAMNIRMGSTEKSEVGVVTNTNGNLFLTTLAYTNGTPLSVNARCIGAIENSTNETIYWFVHDPTFPIGATGKLDLIVSYNVLTNVLVYHVISINDGGNINTTLNFNKSYLITGVNLIDNLLFFTDDYNPPRFININKNYANPSPSNIDYFIALPPAPLAPRPDILKEALLVIKRPPKESPTIQPITTSGQENYLETRFICFAYRYKYADGEYSATSQWSAAAFVPKQFQFSINSMVNEGMTNFCNSVIVNYNSGGPLVVGIELLFKQSENNIIKIIQQLDKAHLGLADNMVYQFTFNNSKIFTVLSEAEILRLYDNVPLVAKAQTIMGNRLMYGNYVEGYDLIDKIGNPVRLEFSTTLLSEEIGNIDVPDGLDTGIYNIDPSSTNLSIADSILTIDLTDRPLVEGASIGVDLAIGHSQWTGTPPFPDETTDGLQLSFSFLLTTTYNSVYEMATSPEFEAAIGTALNILPVSTTVVGQDTSCAGTTLTDAFNCSVPNNLGSAPNTYTKYESGINSLGATLQPIRIITTPASNIIGLQFPAMVYVDDLTLPTVRYYEYYEITFAQAVYQEIANPRSLHSNRGYEIGMVYMDEFNRGTTALVSPFNAEHVPCGYSPNKNSIQVTIPVSQRAPKWAKRYKFVIKPDEERYETIYSNLFFINPETNEAWLLLEGENMRKVEDGDRLIVKSDTQGPTLNCTYTTVLEKTAQSSGFLEIPNVDDPTQNINVPAGLYIKVNPSDYNLVRSQNAIIAPGTISDWASGGDHKIMPYPMNIPDPANPGQYIDYNVPAGSRIEWSVDWNRAGVAGKCERRGYNLTKVYTSTNDYDNMYDWFVGDNIQLTINSGTDKGDNETNEFIPGTGTQLNTVSTSINYWQFYRNPSTQQLQIFFSSTNSCDGKNYKYSRRINITAKITVFRAESVVCFETLPLDALPDVFFENELSFEIDSDGNHIGNVQDQDIASGTPGIVDTNFFNCYAFGNGVESYKIRDSILGRSVAFGERVNTVAAQDYKAADRFSDITYSGIYNGESNINRLNQFNSGLLNFKHCEASFGPILLLDGRNTDILCLQEDKISYVLAEKNLLSDASAGGIITATPEVLGTQIARTEKYGISFNPESYIQWGFDRYFTDAKRGAVIQLKGGDNGTEQLTAISEQSMRTWFRDEFNASLNFQKLGGFDPYMNEYVLSMNEELLPINPQCLACGVSQTFTFSIDDEESKFFEYCVDLGPLIGVTEITWDFITIEPSAEIKITVVYNGVTTTTGYTGLSGSFFFDKNNVSIETADITIEYTGDMVVSVLVDCCLAEPMTIVEVVVTNNSEVGKTIHTQYRYTDLPFVGPLFSNLVFFGSGTAIPLVSRYNTVSGFVGTGGFPPEGSIMRLSTNQIVPDNYVFDIAQDKFRYLRSTTLFNNTDLEIQALLIASSLATPNSGTAPLYYADFTVPPSVNGEFLYLIWDLRDAIPAELCFGTTRIDSCCNCVPGDYFLNASFASATCVFNDDDLVDIADNGFYSADGIVRELVNGILLPQQPCAPCGVEVELCFGTSAVDVCCNCDLVCTTNYNYYEVTNNEAFNTTVFFYDQNGVLTSLPLLASATNVIVCSVGAPYSTTSITITDIGCNCFT